MGKASRAIVIEDGKLLVMHRNKYGSQYYTLVGGRVNDGETTEQALVRELREETGLTVTAMKLVFTETHQDPHNEQYVYLSEVAPHDSVAIQDYSEEGQMNRIDMNTHKPEWVSINAFEKLPFRTPRLQAEVIKALRSGFPKIPLAI